MMLRRIKLLCLAAIILLFCNDCLADTLVLENGKRIKGLILDNYKDRIVISTFEGEKTVLKSKIRSVVYDSDTKVLLQKARNLHNKHKYVKAYYAYEKVLDNDPTQEEAKQRYDYLRSYLESEMRYEMQSGVRQNEELFENVDGLTSVDKINTYLGIVLTREGDYVSVLKVRKGSPAGESGIRKGDRIVSIWGELASFRDTKDVAQMLLAPGEMRIVVEREVYPFLSKKRSILDRFFSSRYKRTIGASLCLERKGISVVKLSPEGSFFKAGIKKGDLLCEVGDVHTRYMEMSDLKKMFKQNRGEKLPITIQRNITFWNKE